MVLLAAVEYAYYAPTHSLCDRTIVVADQFNAHGRAAAGKRVVPTRIIRGNICAMSLDSRQRQSLYFDYVEYPFARPAELDGAARGHQVAVVGAGPVGLATALDLAKRGIEVVVLEAGSTVCGGSRATCVARRSLEVLHLVGAAQPIYRKGMPWTSGQSFYRGQLVYRLEMPHSDDERYYPMINIQQNYVELFLLEELNQCASADLRWSSRVTRISQHEDGVSLGVETPEGAYTLQAEYVVAADGAHSTLRELMDLRLAGRSYEGAYLIADIKLKSEYPTQRRAWFDPPSNPGSTVLMHKQPDDIWRVDFQLIGDEAKQTEFDESQLRRRIQQQLDMCGETGEWELDWYSIYKAHCLCLDDYRQGRVFFVGDAAHLVPIFGVRGLNSGIADAGNLGWKLAYVLNAWSPEVLLDSYSAERRPATLEIFREAGKSTQFMTPQTRGYRLLRQAALSLAISEEFTRPLVNPRQTQPYDYVGSVLNATGDDDGNFDDGPRVGAPASNVQLGADDYLLDHLGMDFTVLCLQKDPVVANEIVDRLSGADLPDDRCRVLIITDSRPDAAAGAGDLRWLHGDSHLFDRYGVRDSALYLVRPDGHVAGRWHGDDFSRIPDAIRQASMRH